MSEKSTMKKETQENKFERKYWVDNRAKRCFVRFLKKYNNKKFRRLIKERAREEIETSND